MTYTKSVHVRVYHGQAGSFTCRLSLDFIFLECRKSSVSNSEGTSQLSLVEVAIHGGHPNCGSSPNI